MSFHISLHELFFLRLDWSNHIFADSIDIQFAFSLEKRNLGSSKKSIGKWWESNPCGKGTRKWEKGAEGLTFSREKVSLRQTYTWCFGLVFIPAKLFCSARILLLPFSSKPACHRPSFLAPYPTCSYISLSLNLSLFHLGLGRIALTNDESASRPQLNCTINCTLRAWYATVSSAIGRPWPRYRFLETVFGTSRVYLVV